MVLRAHGVGSYVALALAVVVLVWPVDAAHAEENGELTHRQFVCPVVETAANVLPTAYAQLREEPVPVYGRPQDEGNGVAPVRITKRGYNWVSLSDPQPIAVNGQNWYRINEGEYVRAEYLRIGTPSTFQGVMVPQDFHKRFAWMIFHTQVSNAPGEQPALEEDPAVVPARTLVIIHEIKEVEDTKWCRIGTGVWVPYRRLAMVTPTGRPEGIKPGERWSDVNLAEQTLAAYEGDRLVFATLSSSGDERFPTISGIFRIWMKVRSGKMSGGDGDADRYYVEDVPWNQYFYRSYALHAAYWHDYFGLPNSHGCVNISPKDALWLFEWTNPVSKSNWQAASQADPGTWVWVHNTPPPLL